MRNLLKVLFVAALVVPMAAQAQIRNTKHDLSVSSATTGPKATGETQVCKFCHAAHRGTQPQLIWNRAQSTVAGWATGQNTQGGTALPTAMQGNSRLCLSCHDGVIALGALASEGATPVAGLTAPIAASARVGNLTNLFGDHPVSVKYPNAGAGTYFTNQTGGNVVTADFVAAATINAGTTVKLFTDATTSAQGIECASCHDVHAAGAARTNGFFLRAPAAGSAICTACHNK